MEEFKKLYFTLFSDVAYVIEEFQGNPIYEPIIKRLIRCESGTNSKVWMKEERITHVKVLNYHFCTFIFDVSNISPE